jgi:hypothetical protein
MDVIFKAVTPEAVIARRRAVLAYRAEGAHSLAALVERINDRNRDATPRLVAWSVLRDDDPVEGSAGAALDDLMYAMVFDLIDDVHLMASLLDLLDSVVVAGPCQTRPEIPPRSTGPPPGLVPLAGPRTIAGPPGASALGSRGRAAA